MYDFTPFGDASTIPGDPIEVGALAQRYADTVTEIDAAVRQLTSIKNNTDGNWEGLAGPHFQDKTGDLASRIEQTKSRYEAAGTALNQFSTDLDNAQWDAAQAAQLGRTAQQTMNANTPAPPPPAGSPKPTPAQAQAAAQAAKTKAGNYQDASGDYTQAKNAFDAAVTAWHNAGKAASKTIQDAINHDGLKDSWWYRHFELLKTILAVVGMVIAVVAIVALVLSCPFLLALLPGALGAFMTATFAAGTAAAAIVGDVVIGTAVAGIVAGTLSLSLDSYGKSAGMDVSWGDIAWDIGGLALSIGGLGASKYIDSITEGGVDAASTTAGIDATRDIEDSLDGSEGILNAAYRMNAGYDVASDTVQAFAAASAPSRAQMILYGLGDSGKFAQLEAVAASDPAAVTAALEKIQPVVLGMRGGETIGRYHEYTERYEDLRELVGLGPTDPTAAISGSVNSHLVPTS
jgi:uncharacterized protein YukE